MENLENKVGYRILKVLYYFLVGVSFIFFIIFLINYNGDNFLLIFNVIFYILVEITNLGLFYIFFGKLENYKYNIFYKIKNIIKENKKEQQEKNITGEKKYKIGKWTKISIFFSILSILAGISMLIKKEDGLINFLLGINLFLVSLAYIPLEKRKNGFNYNIYILLSLNFLIFFSTFFIVKSGGEKFIVENGITILPNIIYFCILFSFENIIFIKTGNNKIIILNIFLIFLASLILFIPKQVDKEIKNNNTQSEFVNYNNEKFDYKISEIPKTEKELFLEELKKEAGEKNEKISENLTLDNLKLKKEGFKDILEYSYTVNTEKYKDNFDLNPIKNNALKNLKNPEDKETLEFIENIKKFDIYLRFKYFDINGKYFGGFEIVPYEIKLYETKKYESNLENIKIPEIKNENYKNFRKTENIIKANTNLRRLPGKNSEKIRVLKKGEKVYYFEEQYITEKDGYEWMSITTEKGEFGYIVVDGIID